jgi:hypothetical protein
MNGSETKSSQVLAEAARVRSEPVSSPERGRSAALPFAS